MIPEISRRSFLKLLGVAVSTAAAAPALIKPSPALAAPPKVAEPTPLLEDILSRDSIFNRHCIIKSVSFYINKPRGVEVVASRMDAFDWYLGDAYLDLTVIVTDDRLMQLAYAAHQAHDVVPLDLIALRRAHIDQSKLKWVIETMRLSTAMDRNIEMDLRLRQIGDAVYEADESGGDYLVAPNGRRL